jgi:hypothetical protein
MNGKQCPCCGQPTLDPNNKYRYDICPVCGWEDDPIQDKDPDYMGAANSLSLNLARRAYAASVPLRSLEQLAKKRNKERMAHAKAVIEARGEEFTAYQASLEFYNEDEERAAQEADLTQAIARQD